MSTITNVDVLGLITLGVKAEQYFHLYDSDGLCSAICRTCFEVAAVGFRVDDLTEQKKQHQCVTQGTALQALMSGRSRQGS